MDKRHFPCRLSGWRRSNVPVSKESGRGGSRASQADDKMLRASLRAQHESVLAIVEGLSEEAWHRSVVVDSSWDAGALGRRRMALVSGRRGGKEPELPGDVNED